MKESDISGPAELDAALAGKAMSKREKLWRIAEGRSCRWTDLVTAIIGGLLTLTGIYGLLVKEDIVGAFQVAFGLGSICFSMLRHQQSQIDALREIVSLQDRRNT